MLPPCRRSNSLKPLLNSAEAPSIAPPASDSSAPIPSLPVQEPESAALPEFDVDPGPIGARRARIAEVAAARQTATTPPAPTIAGGETVARGARIESPTQPAHVVTDDSPFAADIARIDDLSRQVASIAEELARLRMTCCNVWRKRNAIRRTPIPYHRAKPSRSTERVMLKRCTTAQYRRNMNRRCLILPWRCRAASRRCPERVNIWSSHRPN